MVWCVDVITLVTVLVTPLTTSVVVIVLHSWQIGETDVDETGGGVGVVVTVTVSVT